MLPGATVTLTNEASGDRRVTVTNNDGFFSFSAVPAATYSVVIELSGFGKTEFTGIELQAGDSRSLRTIPLKVGGLSETITVSAEPSLTPLTSGEKSATLTAKQIETLPIVGTSTAEVLRTLPGMTPVTNGTTNRPNFTGEVYGINGNGEFQGGGNNNQSAIGNFSGNGTRTQALDITIDGAPGADPGCNCATSVNPNSEFVQEFKVLQSNFGAEHAKGPVAMTVVSKSGGRDFHGSAFASIRDYRLNSNEWFANKIDAEKVKNKFFYPGFNVGGPLMLPGGMNKSRDKLFFFVGYEYFKQRLDTGFIKSWVPTDAMRNGDFSNPSAVGSGSFVNTPIRGFAERHHPGQPDRSRRPRADEPVPAAERRPERHRRLQLRRQPAGRSERLSAPRARRRQHQRHHQDVRPLQHAARDAAVRDRPVVAQRRTPAAVSVADRGAQPVRLGDGEPDQDPQPDPDQRDDHRGHLHRFPERVLRPAGDLAPGARLPLQRRVRRERSDPVDRRAARAGR